MSVSIAVITSCLTNYSHFELEFLNICFDRIFLWCFLFYLFVLFDELKLRGGSTPTLKQVPALYLDLVALVINW